MPNELLQGLVNINNGVAVPQGLPILQGENPLSGLQGLPAGTIPTATAAPDLTANPAPQVKSLEELLFGGGLGG